AARGSRLSAPARNNDGDQRRVCPPRQCVTGQPGTGRQAQTPPPPTVFTPWWRPWSRVAAIGLAARHALRVAARPPRVRHTDLVASPASDTSTVRAAEAGCYEAQRAAALVGIPLSTLYYWAKTGVVVPSISPVREKLWSYADLMAVRIVSWLRHPKDSGEAVVPGTTMAEVRRALAFLAEAGIDLWGACSGPRRRRGTPLLGGASRAGWGPPAAAHARHAAKRAAPGRARSKVTETGPFGPRTTRSTYWDRSAWLDMPGPTC